MSSSQPADRPVRVLFIEDDASVRHATRFLLQVEGYEVLLAASAEQALQSVCADPHIDLIISDYRLGARETGADVIAAVRERLSRCVGALLLTGDTSVISQLHPDPNLRIASKPIHADHLLALLAELRAGAGAA